MHIHFVSYGNVFRSRLAEAYLRFLFRKNKSIHVSSSGIHPEPVINGPITWYAMKVLAEHELIPFMSLEVNKTTATSLLEKDVVIFLDAITQDYCHKHLGYLNKNATLWLTNYIPVSRTEDVLSLEKAKIVIEQTEKIFNQIKDHCCRLADELTYTDVPFRL